ncbi:MAG: hypothetical protein H7Y60_09835 [Rhodospirillaceae bacterium]|nr:hypothetical protein [Rhodospirillales bacterium]
MTERSPTNGPFLIEVAVWAEGVYQWQADDAILGGPEGNDNWPIQALANRTLYLKDQMEASVSALATHVAAGDHQLATTGAKGMVVLSTVDEAVAGVNPNKSVTPEGLGAAIAVIAAAIAGKAPLDAPHFTGVSTAVTAAPGTANTQIATTEFVQGAVGGFGDLAYKGIGQGLEDDGADNVRVKLDGPALARSAAGLRTLEPTVTLVAATVIDASYNGMTVIADGAVTLTMAKASTLGNGFRVTVLSVNGATTIAPNAADKIGFGGVGAVASLPIGRAAHITTDGAAAGTLYMEQYDGPSKIVYPSSKTVFSHTGGDQTYTVEAGVNRIRLKLWAAGGGGDNYSTQARGAGGGFVWGELAVVPGDVLTIVVGAGGIFGGLVPTYGGGGPGVATYGASGGGRTAIRRGGADVATAGAGGASGNTDLDNTGVGGGTTGGDGTGAGGKGGTQTAGGAAATGAVPGSLGQGGSGYNQGGGGGGGYYGGGGGGGGTSGAGGGSSFIANLINGGTISGNGWQAGGSADSDYAAGIGNGGILAGGHGRAVIY